MSQLSKDELIKAIEQMPYHAPDYSPDQITLRDRFALATMTAFRVDLWETGGTHKEWAEHAYRFADAMLEARK